ncbi:hypothetical protein ASC77_12375 [Nocardioides sp. Root1257]|uniref:hypothetical protein n=1 Tax=unclassified Nocardioides TaxID=2615069 RepID=UPI0006FA2511|nr:MULTISPECIES: hypothetical protein [unclassified Nocardioides]KQW47273.1 hypothetical protein ASC77_12375 [Nocardioides sp. Root1257]KRC45429.1 hypothetical protein ASE24_12380 [Nocardioides sp. Root224]
MTALDARTAAADLGEVATTLAARFVTWLETGERPPDLFADDVFADLTVPHWRVQAEGVDAVFHLREDEHPFPGTVRVEALDRTSRGFLLQFEERWRDGGQDWYCRELIHAVVTDGRISELAISCTGDWDEERQRLHADQVRLLRP